MTKLRDDDRTTVATFTSTMLAELAAVRSASTYEMLFEAMNDLEAAWKRLEMAVDDMDGDE